MSFNKEESSENIEISTEEQFNKTQVDTYSLMKKVMINKVEKQS
jgi:hypothetical protein